MPLDKEILFRLKESVSIEIEEAAKIFEWLDSGSLLKAVEALSKVPRIMTAGCGNSGIACKKFAHTLCCAGKNAAFMSPAEAVHGGMGGLYEGDAMVILSRGGKTSELLPIAEICNRKKIKLITFTENTESPLARMSDITVPFKIERESDKYNYMATTSVIIPLILFDAVIAGIMEETGYRREDFGLIHPNGAVGAMLKTEKQNTDKERT